MTHRKKLIEVALPLEAINRESAREKSIRHGHPSTLHLWWARRPLAACRAVLFASIVDDPSSRPDLFPTEEEQEVERQRLFRLIEELVKWENTTNETVLEAAREEIRKATDGNPPPVLDPFCGGGSIPLEAQRLGLEAHASDLNPVAVLITKALIEIPPKFAGRPPVNPESRAKLGHDGTWQGAQGLAEDVRYYGKWMRDEAFQRIGHLYPNAKLPDGDEAHVLGWIWCRTIVCPNPSCGAEIPLVRSFSLANRANRHVRVEPIVDRSTRRVEFNVVEGEGATHAATVGRAGATCLVCNQPVDLAHVRSEGRQGRIGVRLMAIIADTKPRRSYLRADTEHADVALAVHTEDAPESSLPRQGLGFRVQGYGLTEHRDLFTERQLACLTTMSDLVRGAHDRLRSDGADPEYAVAVCAYLALAVGRVADLTSALVAWLPSLEAIRNTFPRGALPMGWDFVEANPLHDKWNGAINWICNALEHLPVEPHGYVEQRDARTVAGKRVIVCTDPPYYDNIGYADLSDFFYVWLRRALGTLMPTLFSTLLTPKDAELIADPSRWGGRQQAEEFFERGLGEAFEAVAQMQDPAFPVTIFYAFKQAESEERAGATTVASTGWETMLEGVIRAGLSIDGTWPMRTERGARVRGIGSNALGSSVVLVCRPRRADAQITDRRSLVGALRVELPDALRKLQHGNIAPVDLAQAAIGPGMAVFSRFAKVIEADGQPMTVRAALALINQTLDEILAEEEGDFDADTRFAVAWFDEIGTGEGEYGRADVLARAKNTSVSGMERAGILTSHAGRVRLLRRDELGGLWDPAGDPRLTVWEVAQHLIKRLDEGGEDAAADLLRRVGGLGEAARELAYRLYTTSERKGWAQEALAYNALVVAWPEIARRVAGTPEAEAQQALEV